MLNLFAFTVSSAPKFLHGLSEPFGTDLATKKNPNLFFAGQMTGVEGCVESAASGLVAGINAVRRFRGEEPVVFPQTTAIGALPFYITHTESKHFQPMNVTYHQRVGRAAYPR